MGDDVASKNQMFRGRERSGTDTKRRVTKLKSTQTSVSKEYANEGRERKKKNSCICGRESGGR